jgi:hypothetical protein
LTAGFRWRRPMCSTGWKSACNWRRQTGRGGRNRKGNHGQETLISADGPAFIRHILHNDSASYHVHPATAAAATLIDGVAEQSDTQFLFAVDSDSAQERLFHSGKPAQIVSLHNWRWEELAEVLGGVSLRLFRCGKVADLRLPSWNAVLMQHPA